MSKAQEAQQFLQDLDAFDTPAVSSPAKSGSGKTPTTPSKPGEAAEVIAFLDEITQKSSEPTRASTHLERPDRPASRSSTPSSLRKKTERVRMGVPSGLGDAGATGSGLASASLSKPGTPKTETAPSIPAAGGGGGWGWGSVWSGASTVLQQAKSVVDEQVKALPSNLPSGLPSNEQTAKWGGGLMDYAKNAQELAKNAQEYAKSSAQEYAKTAQEYAKTAQLDKLGQDFRKVGLSTLTDILNVVAPPISDHEVLQVWLSHDMVGYEGVEGVVYKALTRIMEQVEGGDLIVNRGDESKPKAAPDAPRELNAVEGFDAAIKLAQAEIQEMQKRDTKSSEQKESTTEAPVTYSHIYLRVQPYKTTISIPQTNTAPSPDGTTAPNAPKQTHTISTTHFLLHLSDPGHKLQHTSLTQSIPETWLARAVWDKYDWVEDSVVDVIRQGVEVLGQDYIARRMGWIAGDGDENSAGEGEADGQKEGMNKKGLEKGKDEESEGDEEESDEEESGEESE